MLCVHECVRAVSEREILITANMHWACMCVCVCELLCVNDRENIEKKKKPEKNENKHVYS